MGKEDYISTGGSLKLKGVRESGIKKKKKKKKPATPDPTSEQKSREGSAKATSADGLEEREEEPEDPYAGKTETERRFEERKRKRVCVSLEFSSWMEAYRLQMDERLKKDGIKSHKERVEEFNKYLSNLSEHHDMLVLTVPPVVFLVLTCIGLVLDQANTFRGKFGYSIGVFSYLYRYTLAL